MVVRMRKNRAQRDARRSQQGYKGQSMIMCPECASKKLPHKVCDNCGMYKGRMVVDVNAEMARKQKRKQAKMKARGEEEATDEKKTTEVKS